MVNHIDTLSKLESCPLSIDVKGNYYYLLLKDVSKEDYEFITGQASQNDLKVIFDEDECFSLGCFVEEKAVPAIIDVVQYLDRCIDMMEYQMYCADIVMIVLVVISYLLNAIFNVNNPACPSVDNDTSSCSGSNFFSLMSHDRSQSCLEQADEIGSLFAHC